MVGLPRSPASLLLSLGAPPAGGEDRAEGPRPAPAGASARRRLLAAALSLALAAGLVNPAGPAAAPDPIRIAVLGDSLSSGYGLGPGASFPEQLEEALRRRGYAVEVQNAGVAGDTAAGGRARTEWVLASRPHLLVVELGANDGLRRLPVDQMEAHLDAILAAAHRAGARPLLTGMRAPANLGRGYARAFQAVFPRLARAHGVPLYPFFLEGVAGVPALNQPDGIHPNRDGVARIVEGILPLMIEAIEALSTSGAASPR
ncbi:MAG: arylesterase [Deferrisomatales bacterium]